MNTAIDRAFCTQAAKGLKPQYLKFKEAVSPLNFESDTDKEGLVLAEQQLAALLTEIYIVYREGGVENSLVTTLMTTDSEQPIPLLDLIIVFSEDSPFMKEMLVEFARRKLPITDREISAFGDAINACLAREDMEERLTKAALN